MRHPTVQFPFALLIFAPVIFLGCDSDTGPHGEAGDIAYADQKSDSEGMTEQGCKQVQNLSLESLLCNEENRERVDYQQNDFGSFKMPSGRSPGAESASELREFFGDNVEYATSLGFSNRHGVKRPGEGFVENGSSVGLHLSTVHDREEYISSTASLTVLLNYKEVDAKIENWNPERTKLEGEKTGATATFEIDDDVEHYDFTIPAEAFDGPGRYDIAVLLSGTGEPNTGSVSQNFTVFYGSCEPQPMTCFHEGEVDGENEVEKVISKEFYTDSYLYPVGDLAGKNPLERIKVAPGQEITLRYRFIVGSMDKLVVAVPLLNGEPVGEPQYTYLPSEPGPDSNIEFPVGAGRRIILTVPEEPGDYTVELAQFTTPFLTRAEADLLDLATTGFSWGSNHLTFRVE